MQFLTTIEQEARTAAQVVVMDSERQKAFLKGSRFALDRLARLIMPDHYDSMMDKGTVEYVDGLRLNDVREALQSLLALTKIEEEIKEAAPVSEEQIELDKVIEDAAMDATCTYHEKMKFVRGANFATPLIRESTIKEMVGILKSDEAEMALYEHAFGWAGPRIVANYLKDRMDGTVK